MFSSFLGWWMVKSGLVERPDVSHLRLAAHLISAFGLISYIFWVMLGLYFQKPFPAHKKLNRWIKLILVLVVLQILYGAFVAGLKAGLLCPVFPAMCNVDNLLAGNWTGNLTLGMPEYLVKLNLQNIHRLTCLCSIWCNCDSGYKIKRMEVVRYGKKWIKYFIFIS